MHSSIASPSALAVQARMLAASAGLLYDGRNTPHNRALLGRCTWRHLPTGTDIIFTRDAGMHASGWWKNPDFDRCFHLSLSFVDVDLVNDRFYARPQDRQLAARWCWTFFQGDARKLWIEPPFSDVGKARDVYHYRLFVDEGWQPITPRGEVYSKRYTPAGWRSWSDIHGADNGDGNFGAPNATES